MTNAVGLPSLFLTGCKIFLSSMTINILYFTLFVQLFSILP